MRLDKMLGMLHVCSRRECPALLARGRVQVDGVPALKPDMYVTEASRIALDGKVLDTRLDRCLIMNKPSGILTAAEDKNCETVMDILPPVYTSLGCMPVGRLDKDTTGLLLLTTDGQLAHRLISPKCHISKVYQAVVDGELDEGDVRAFEAGIPLKDFTCLPAKLDIVRPAVGMVTVYEGKYHQVKRMFGSRGKPVLALKRISFGPFILPGDLAEGEYREMTEEETDQLYAAAGMEGL